MTDKNPPPLPEAMEQAMRARAEDLLNLAALLRADHADTVRSVAASLTTIADGQIPITPAPATGYRLIYVGDHAERTEPLLDSLLPAMQHVFSVGANVVSFGMITPESGPYILADRPVGEPERTVSAGPHANRCSRGIHGCSVEWVQAVLCLAEAS